ncbi:MAG: hypothetical protein R3F39_05795 [Myxococcota bacterium]
MSDKPDRPPERAHDVLLISGPAPDGKGTRVLRQRDGQVELGLLRPVVSGQALTGELVRLTPRSEAPSLFDVHVEATAPIAARPERTEDTPAARSHAGPAKVSNATFRAGWDAIWGARPTSERRLLN